ncbi:MAG: hypothetical protein M3Y90_15175 [Actinomycetota bacterium]|nr:hypothetical protein [Actinomycetota bacterium]
MTDDDLPNVFVHDGHVETMLIARPGWLLAWRTTDLDTGMATLSIYRSLELRDTDDWYEEAAGLVGAGELLKAEVLDDVTMWSAHGELAMYSQPEAVPA